MMGQLKPDADKYLEYTNRTANYLYAKDPTSSELLDLLDALEVSLDFFHSALIDEDTRSEVWYSLLPNIDSSAPKRFTPTSDQLDKIFSNKCFTTADGDESLSSSAVEALISSGNGKSAVSLVPPCDAKSAQDVDL